MIIDIYFFVLRRIYRYIKVEYSFLFIKIKEQTTLLILIRFFLLELFFFHFQNLKSEYVNNKFIIRPPPYS